ncbi:hypothetical protein A9995_06780 [Erythrobacter sp. QSSC1-22B]|nr:hypothetical protein A9995_06780 [Erythrobacter sp. QSSC1-22B]
MHSEISRSAKGGADSGPVTFAGAPTAGGIAQPPSTGVSAPGPGAIGSRWDGLDSPERALALEIRDVAHLARATDRLFDRDPFEWIGAGTPAEAVAALGILPPPLATDILDLATRFDDLMKAGGVRIRLALVVTNSCRKIHSDYTDLRLITTYSGPGTQVLPMGAEKAEANLWSMATGWIGLFKGRLFREGHSACLHRSPPAGDLGVRRLVLVIDTPSSAPESALA